MEGTEDRRERERQMKKAKYDYCKAKGVCVICCREAAFYHHVRCPGCMEKAAAQKARRTAAMTQAQRDRKNEQNRERYRRHKEAGLCTNCGKSITNGAALCHVCLLQQRRAGENYRTRHGLKKGWAEAGLCLWCGAEPAEERKLCPDCLERSREQMA